MEAENSVIAGTVRSSDGEPLAGVTVEALRLNAKHAAPASIARTSTDDLGSYRLFNLPSGQYIVAVQLPPSFTQQAQDHSALALYYPATSKQNDATVMGLLPASTINGIDVTVNVEAPLSNQGGASTENAATIVGHVRNHLTGEPLTDALVVLSHGNERGKTWPLQIKTDKDGGFSFLQVPAGNYSVIATHPGYLTNRLAQQTISAGASIASDLKLFLVPQSVLAGRVTAEGKPISNAVVTANQITLVDGQRKLAIVKRATTNDLGGFRIFGLYPGSYYVSASSHTSQTDSPDDPDQANEEFATTFFSNAPFFPDAAPIDLKEGTERSDVDIALFRTHLWSLHGTVVLPQSGSLFGGSIALQPRDPVLSLKQRERTSGVNPRNGSFQIEGVAPGRYTLVANGEAAGMHYSAALPVDVGNADVEGVTVSLSPSLQIHGNVRVEQGDKCNIADLRIAAVSLGDSGTVQSIQAETDSNGVFILEGLRADHFQFSMNDVQTHCYLKAVSSGSHITDPYDVDLTQAASLQLILSAQAATIEGVVMDGSSHIVKSVQVVLVPQAPLDGVMSLYKKTAADEDGRFQLQGVAPGDYVVYVQDAMDSRITFDHVSQGQAVSVSAGNRVQIVLKTSLETVAP